MHTFHIYNNKGKRETIDTLLVGVNSNTWWISDVNKPRRLANGIDNQVRATNTIQFIRKGEVTRGRTVTHANFVCDD